MPGNDGSGLAMVSLLALKAEEKFSKNHPVVSLWSNRPRLA